MSPIEISQEAYGYLKKLPYHGNIRELKNLVERTILISGKKIITDTDFKKQYIEVPSSQPVSGNTILSLERVERDDTKSGGIIWLQSFQNSNGIGTDQTNVISPP